MPFPNFADKHAHDAIITPHHVVAAVRTADDGVVVPDTAVLIYQPAVEDHLDGLGATPVAGYPRAWRAVRIVRHAGAAVAVVGTFGIGAPAAAAVLEELIALGVRRVISMGAAGSLQTDADFGDVVVCDAAIRDEGVSHHYLPAEKFSYPSESLSAHLLQTLVRLGLSPGVGSTWTIDAPYRETLAEARSYRDEGVLTVEMEAAALFAVGSLRNVDVAAAFSISDHLLHEDSWVPGFRTDKLRLSLGRLVDGCIEALATWSGQR